MGGAVGLFRRLSGTALSAVKKGDLLRDVHPRAPAAGDRADLKDIGGRRRKGFGKAGAGRGSVLRLCTQGAQSLLNVTESFRREVEGLTGREEELIYSKVYKSQILVIEQAIETAALMLGTHTGMAFCHLANPYPVDRLSLRESTSRHYVGANDSYNIGNLFRQGVWGLKSFRCPIAALRIHYLATPKLVRRRNYCEY
jgi:hypothetical protein